MYFSREEERAVRFFGSESEVSIQGLRDRQPFARLYLQLPLHIKYTQLLGAANRELFGTFQTIATALRRGYINW